MRKKIFMGIMFIMGISSFADIMEDLGPVGQSSYNGQTKLELRVNGNAVAATSGVQLEIKPTMSKGPDGSSLEFRFGDLAPNAQVRAQGAFTAEVIDYSTPDNPVKLNLKDKVKVILSNKNEQDLKNTAQQNIGKIKYTLLDTKGGEISGDGTITQDMYTYEGKIESYIVVNSSAPSGEFYNDGTSITVKVTEIAGTTDGTN